MKNLISSFITILSLIILAVPLKSQDCITQSQVIIVDNDTTLLSIVVENALSDTLGQNGQGLCGVNIDFNHEYVGDLLVELIAPNGQVVLLMGPPTTNSSSTDLINWDISFVPCLNSASPDADFDDVWNNFNNWALISNYTGSYYPFFGCLEDFNGGQVNGTWTLRIDDISLLGEGIINSFELIFCETTGLGCFECNPNGGVINPSSLEFCEGDPNLNFDFNPDFQNNLPDPTVYDFIHIISSNDVVVAYSDFTDLSSYEPGNYQVCGLSVLADAVMELPVINGTFGIDSIEHQISLGLLCGETTLGCYSVEVYNVPDTLFLQDTICRGQSFQVGSEFFDTEQIHEVTLFNGQCDSIVVLDLEVLDITAMVVASDLSIACSDNFITLDGTSSILEGNTSVFWTTSDGQILSNPSELIIDVASAGTYTMTLSEGSCTESTSITINSEEQLPEIIFEQVGAFDCITDSIQLEITVSGIVQDVQWEGPLGFTSGIEDPFVYSSGLYTVSVTNSFGCIGVDSIEIGFDFILDIPSFTYSTLTCDSLQTQIQTEIDNATDYIFNWSGLGGAFTSMEMSPIVTDPGMYILSLAGANGCTEIYELEVIQDLDFPDFTITVDTVLCNNPFATIEVEAPSNTQINWQDSSLGNNFTVAVQNVGQYNFELTALNGCKIDTFATVTVDTLLPILSLTDSLVIDCVDSIQLQNTYQNINDNSTYSWEGPFGFESNLPNPFVYDQGLYTVLVVNDNGCQRSGSIEVVLGDQEPQFIFEADTIDCNNPQIDISVTNDTTGYSFLWSGTADFTSVIPGPTIDSGGSYVVTVTDSSTDCTARYQVDVVSELIPVEINLFAEDLDCFMTPVDLIYQVTDFEVSTASWAGASFMFIGDTAAVTVAGTYYLELSGVNGCVYTDSIEVLLNVEEPQLIVQDTFIGCSQNGINLELISSLPVETYNWSGPGLSSDEASPLVTTLGEYTVTVTATNGCQSEATINVSEDINIPSIEVSGGLELDCLNPSTEILILSNSDINTYEWSGPQVVGNVSSAIISEPGDYSVTITAPNFCVNEVSFTINFDGIPPQFQTEIVEISCANDEQGTFTVTSMEELVSYIWTGPNGFMEEGASINVSEPGMYTVEVTDVSGCTSIATYSITSSVVPPEVINVIDGEITCETGNTIIGVETLTPIQSYNWSGPDGFTFAENFPIVNLDGVYTVELVDSFGCSLVQDIEVNIDTISPILEIIGSTLNCFENKVELSFETDQTDFTYIWSGPNNFTSDELKPVVNFPGPYSVTVVGPNGCTAIETYTVVEDYTGPDIEAFDTSLPCNDQPVILQVSSSTENVEFIWFGPNGFISEFQNPFTTNVGEYIVVATGPNGCISRDTIMVDDVPVLPVFDYSTDIINCYSPEVNVNALLINDDASVMWSGPEMFTSDSSQITVDVPGFYQLIVTGLNGCVDTALVEVGVDTLVPFAKALSNEKLKCTIEEIILDGTTSDVGPFYQPFWTTLNGQIIDGESSYSPTVSKTGLYYLQVQDTRNGCIGLDSIMVEEVPNTLSEVIIDVVEPLCFGYTNGSAHILEVQGGDAPYTYAFNSNFYSAIQDFYLLPSGEHTISVKDSAGCILDTTFLIQDGLDIDVSLGPDTLIRLGESIDIKALSNVDFTEIADVRWLPTPQENCNVCMMITESPLKTTQYNVRITDLNGCTAEDDIIVRVKDESPLYVPNVFSPNNDDVNERFMIFGGKGVAQIDYINILDRWGNIVFEAFEFQPEDTAFSWDGIYRGKPLQPAVFSYILGYTMLNGVERQEAGTITLMR